MGSIADYLETILLDWVFKANSRGSSPPAQLFLGLASDAATREELETGSLTNEITVYYGDRPQVEFTDVYSNEDGDAEVTNESVVEFEFYDDATAAFVFVADNPTKGEGHILWVAEFAEPQRIRAGNVLRLPYASLKCSLG